MANDKQKYYYVMHPYEGDYLDAHFEIFMKDVLKHVPKTIEQLKEEFYQIVCENVKNSCPGDEDEYKHYLPRSINEIEYRENIPFKFKIENERMKFTYSKNSKLIGFEYGVSGGWKTAWRMFLISLYDQNPNCKNEECKYSFEYNKICGDCYEFQCGKMVESLNDKNVFIEFLNKNMDPSCRDIWTTWKGNDGYLGGDIFTVLLYCINHQIICYEDLRDSFAATSFGSIYNQEICFYTFTIYLQNLMFKKIDIRNKSGILTKRAE